METGNYPELGTKLGPCELKEVIGEGSIARVYRASDEKEDQDVAVKVFAKGIQIGRGNVNLIEKQHRRLGPGIRVQKILRWGVAEPWQYQVLELMGETLKDAMSRNELPIGTKQSILLDIIQILSEMHEKGYAHGQLQPSNIFLDEDARPMLADMGIVRNVEGIERGRQRSGNPSQTVQYISPESPSELKSSAIATKSDVFQFSILAYELFSGKLPHKTADLTDPLDVTAMYNERPTPLNELCPELDRNIAAAIMRGFEVIAEQRVDICELEGIWYAGDTNAEDMKWLRWLRLGLNLVVFIIFLAIVGPIAMALYNKPKEMSRQGDLKLLSNQPSLEVTDKWREVNDASRDSRRGTLLFKVPEGLIVEVGSPIPGDYDSSNEVVQLHCDSAVEIQVFRKGKLLDQIEWTPVPGQVDSLLIDPGLSF